MLSRKAIEERLEFNRAALEQARAAYLALLSGQVKSYAIGSRNLTRLDMPHLEEAIRKHENEIEKLEGMLNGGSRRKAVGVVPRDF